MVGWHHWLSGQGFGWTLGVGDGQGCLACCGSQGRKESDTTEQLNWTDWEYHIFPHNLLIVYHIDLYVLMNPWITGINPNWSWCMILLICCWILFDFFFFLRIFSYILKTDFALYFYFFLVHIFVWFWYQGDGGLVELILKYSSLGHLLKELEKERC